MAGREPTGDRRAALPLRSSSPLGVVVFSVNAGVHRARRAYAPTRRRIARQGHICVWDACAMSFQRSGIKREKSR